MKDIGKLLIVFLLGCVGAGITFKLTENKDEIKALEDATDALTQAVNQQAVVLVAFGITMENLAPRRNANEATTDDATDRATDSPGTDSH